jgi:hypothetical protein
MKCYKRLLLTDLNGVMSEAVVKCNPNDFPVLIDVLTDSVEG